MKKIIDYLNFVKNNIGNTFLPLKFSYANSDINNYLFLTKSGSSPASNVNRGNNNQPNRNEIDDDETVNPDTSSESNIDDDNEEKEELNQKEAEEEDNDNGEDDEDTEEEEGNQTLDNSDDNETKRKIKKSPMFYVYTLLALIIIFIILIIIILFWEPDTVGNAILCGGPSKLDDVKVITTDEDHKKIDSWNFYDWIAAVVNWEMGGALGVVGQVQSIAAVSETLQGKYDESQLAEVREKYLNSWCPEIEYTEEQLLEFAREGKSIPKQFYQEMECDPTWPRDDRLEIVILMNSHRAMGGCDIEYGCNSYENPEIPEFGIKKGKCINVLESKKNHPRANVYKRARFCEIKVSTDIEELKKKYPNRSFVYDASKSAWTVLIVPNSTGGKKPYSEEEQKAMMDMISTIRGLIMVNDDGTPAYTPWKSGEDSVECQGESLYQNNPPTRNDMCHDGKVPLSIVTQANERYWPVHKILTYWYDYRIASWSSSGRASCQMYYPMSDPSKRVKIYNKLDTPRSIGDPVVELDYVEDHDQFITKTIADIEKTNTTEIQNRFNSYIESSVRANGIGSARGVASAAISLINYLEFYNYKLPYSFGGKYNKQSGNKIKYYGINQFWGSPVENSSPKRDFEKEWIPLGFDCTGFTDWVLYNGGLSANDEFAALANIDKYPDVKASGTGENDIYRKYEIRPTHSNIAYLGDIIYRVGDSNGIVHAKVVIGVVFDDNGTMIGNQVAEAKGTSSGVVVSLIDDRTGKPLIKKDIINEEGIVIGHEYTVGEYGTPPETPYGVIDLSTCYNEYGAHYNGGYLCTIATEEEFYSEVDDGRGGKI